MVKDLKVTRMQSSAAKPRRHNTESSPASPDPLGSPGHVPYAVIDLRNPTVRQQVVKSLQELSSLQLRKQQRRAKAKETREGIVKSTPKTVKVQNSIPVADEDQAEGCEGDAHAAVFVERGDLVQDGRQSEQALRDLQQQRTPSRPPSRVSASAAGASSERDAGLTPRSQQILLSALTQIYEQQDLNRMVGQDYLEEPGSPEYSIVHALDESCLLFAVKENQSDPRVQVHSEDSSLESTRKIITPLV